MNTSTVNPVSIKQVQLVIKKHIIDGMGLAAYDIAPKFDNVNYEGDLVADAKAVIACCGREFVHNGNKNTATSKVLVEWLQGLPSIISIAYTNYDILQIGMECGLIKKEYPTEVVRESAEDTFIGGWFNRVALQLLQIARMKQGTKAYNDLIVYCKENNK